LFGVFETPEEMAQGQYRTLRAMQRSGIPTAKPYGCHWIQGNLWLLVTEYLTAKPLSSVEKLDVKQIDTIFSHLRKMHKKRMFHGDVKPDNIAIGRKVYILDVGHLRTDASRSEKQAYDLACLLSSFLHYQPADEIIRIAKKHYSLKHLREAMQYLELVQMRPDIHFNDEMKTQLIFHLNKTPRRFRKRKQ
jgi:tRNA A-37 threonylcarbamoyl transferase component Bud32